MANRVKVKRRDRFDLNEVEPIQLTSQPDDEEAGDDEVEMIHLFSIDDKEFYAPVAVPFYHSVRAMEIMAQRGEAAAVAYTLRTVLGDEGYDALLSFKGLTRDAFESIVKTADKIVHADAGKAR